MKYFRDIEFNCKCGNCNLGIEHMDDRMLIIIDAIRMIVETPLVLTSTIRCQDHNVSVGGSSGSMHLCGRAIDISCNDPKLAYNIVGAALRLGCSGIGIGSTFIHIDLGRDNRIWRYISK